MKTIFSFMFATMLFFAIQSNAVAQQYFTYDGDVFSVQLKTNSANTQVMEVMFSSEGEWHKFDIIDFHDLEDTHEGGFLYTVRDGKGDTYDVDYYRNENYIIVYASDHSTEWTLYKR
jgi:hypothetical protein